MTRDEALRKLTQAEQLLREIIGNGTFGEATRELVPIKRAIADIYEREASA